MEGGGLEGGGERGGVEKGILTRVEISEAHNTKFPQLGEGVVGAAFVEDERDVAHRRGAEPGGHGKGWILEGDETGGGGGGGGGRG